MIDHYKDTKKSEFRFIKNRGHQRHSGGGGKHHHQRHYHGGQHHRGVSGGGVAGAELKKQMKVAGTRRHDKKNKADKYLKVSVAQNRTRHLKASL